MFPYKKILLATDFSEQSRKAAAVAVRVARGDNAQLHVLHVDVIAQQNAEGFDYPPLADYMHRFDQLAMGAVGREVGVSYRDSVTAVIRDTSEASGILRYAAQKDMDLIILGTHGRSPVAEAFMGSVAQRVVRDSPVSVMVVGPQQEAVAPVKGRQVFVAPVDLTARAGLALAHAATLAAEREAHLIALHAIDIARIGRDVPPAQAQEEARDELDHFVARANLPVDAEPMIGVGHADQVIFEVARKRGARLIVMAPSSHGALDRIVFGSVTQRVVRGAPCPVLIHREPSQPAKDRVAA